MEQWKPKSRAMLINNDDLEILSRYNAEIIGLYNFYSLAKIVLPYMLSSTLWNIACTKPLQENTAPL